MAQDFACSRMPIRDGAVRRGANLIAGVSIEAASFGQARQAHSELHDLLRTWGLDGAVTVTIRQLGAPGRWSLTARLSPSASSAWMPGFDTLGLASRVGLAVRDRPDELEVKIALEMLGAPRAFHYPSLQEWRASLHMRRYVVEAGRSARVAFATHTAERPAHFWNWDDTQGWRLNAGADLIEALQQTVAPPSGAPLWSFSCYRATEYVLLLGLARELRERNLVLYERLQACCRKEAIRSDDFVDAFLTEYGTAANPLPVGYFVPGDRVWFRNPDRRSSDVTGYEGSWVIYLGNGQFTNFWKEDAPYALFDKCIEIYHWRDAVVRAADREPTMDEARVERMVAATRASPRRATKALRRMLRWRDLNGQYSGGGCLDRTREHLRFVCPQTADLRLPG